MEQQTNARQVDPTDFVQPPQAPLIGPFKLAFIMFVSLGLVIAVSPLGTTINHYVRGTESPAILEARHAAQALAYIEASRPGDIFFHTNGSVWVVRSVSVTAGTIDLQGSSNVVTAGLRDASSRLLRLVNEQHTGPIYNSAAALYVRQVEQLSPKVAHRN